MGNRYQFGIDTLLAITALYAILFGLLISLGFGSEPVRFTAGVLFLTVVLLGRVLLFGGRRPKTASALIASLLGIPTGIWHVLALVDYRPPAWGKPYPQSGYFAVYSWSLDDVATEVLIVVAVCGLVGLTIGLYVEGFCCAAGLIGRAASRHRPTAGQPQARGGHPFAQGRPGPAGRETSVPSPGAGRPAGSRAQRRRLAIVGCSVLTALLAIGHLFRKPVQIAYYRQGMESAAAKMNCQFMPLALVLAESFGRTTDYDGRLAECRDALVRLRYLEHREFVFQHVASATPESQILRFHIWRTFPDTARAYYEMDRPDTPGPARLHVWDCPERIPQWEAFVAEHDVAEFDERFVHGFDPGALLKAQSRQ